MEPLICPECGGKLDEPSAGSDIAVCEYCTTKFRIGSSSPRFEAAPQSKELHIVNPDDDSSAKSSGGWIASVMILGTVIFVLLFEFGSTKKSTIQTANTAQNVSNSAQSSANSMKQLANLMSEMANRAANVNANAASPTPKRSKNQ